MEKNKDKHPREKFAQTFLSISIAAAVISLNTLALGSKLYFISNIRGYLQMLSLFGYSFGPFAVVSTLKSHYLIFQNVEV